MKSASEHGASADAFKRDALEFESGYGPQTRILFALLSIGERIADLSAEIRRGNNPHLHS